MMRRLKLSTSAFFGAPFWIIPLVLGVIALSLPYLGAPPATLRTIVSIALLSMLTVGLNLTFGFAGELALGQSALYGVGAYLGGYLATKGLGLPLSFVLAIVAAALVGLLTGVPGVRIGSWSLAMVTFFLVLIFPNVLNLIPATAGASGLTGIPLPDLFGAQLDNNGYYQLVIVIAIITFILLRNYVTSRHGTALKVMRESPTLARSLGISVPRMKLTAYVIGALPAGAAGALFAYQDGYISPDSFGFQATIAILAASVIGGNASVYGAIVGAAIMTLGPLQLSNAQQFSMVFFGVLLLVAGLFFTGGIAGLLTHLIWTRFVDHTTLRKDVAALVANPASGLKIEGRPLSAVDVSKDFGGNHALVDVSLSTAPGQVTALIGPNGSGKTTLLNIISGFYPATSGRVEIDGVDVTGYSPTRVARTGVSRTFQTPLIPKSMTAVDVVASARFARERSTTLGAMLRLPGSRRVAREDRSEALKLMSLMGIVELADRQAASLPLGTRRILEVARALAGNPAIVLLDEPASGLDENEVDALALVIVSLTRAGANIVIVEHNFEMIMKIADVVNVLHLGSVIASGTPHDVRNDPQVVESYLGKAARAELEAAQLKMSTEEARR